MLSDTIASIDLLKIFLTNIFRQCNPLPYDNKLLDNQLPRIILLRFCKIEKKKIFFFTVTSLSYNKTCTTG